MRSWFVDVLSSGDEWPDVGGDLSDGQVSLAWFVDVLQVIGGGVA